MTMTMTMTKVALAKKREASCIFFEALNHPEVQPLLAG